MPCSTNRPERAHDRRLVAGLHRQVGLVPRAEDAEALEVLAHDVDVLRGVGPALAAEVGDRHLPLLRAELAVDLQLDRQAVAIPARHVRCIEARHAARLHHEILEDLVERRADVDFAVGVRRAVVKHELRRALPRTAELAVQIHLPPSARSPPAQPSADWPSSRRRCAAGCTCPSTRAWQSVYCNNGSYGCVAPRTGRPRRPRSRPRQRPQGARPGGPHRAAGVGLVLVQGRLEGRRPRPDRRLALGRAHELQGDAQHPARPGQGHHRAVRRHLERLHLDRSDHVSRNRVARRARSHAVHRSRAHERVPLRTGGLRVGAHRHHLGAEGRRERSRAAARHRADGGRLPRASLSASDDRLAAAISRR